MCSGSNAWSTLDQLDWWFSMWYDVSHMSPERLDLVAQGLRCFQQRISNDGLHDG